MATIFTGFVHFLQVHGDSAQVFELRDLAQGGGNRRFTISADKRGLQSALLTAYASQLMLTVRITGQEKRHPQPMDVGWVALAPGAFW